MVLLTEIWPNPNINDDLLIINNQLLTNVLIID